MPSQNPEENLLDVISLKKYFPIRAGLLKRQVGSVKAVDVVSFYVKRGETLGLVGESGCGKTTVGKSIMMLTMPTGGYVFWNTPRVVVEDFKKLVTLRTSAIKGGLKNPQIAEMAILIDKLLSSPSCLISEDKKRHICSDARKLAERARRTEIKVGDGSILSLADEAIEVVADKYCINHMNKRYVRRMRGNIQFVFQDPFSSLDPRMLIKDIISEPMHAQMQFTISEKTVKLRRWIYWAAIGANFAYMLLIASMMLGDNALLLQYKGLLTALSFLMSPVVIGSYQRMKTAIDAFEIKKHTEFGTTLDEQLKSKSKSQYVREETVQLLERVGLNVEHLYRYPHEFSGGQRQRIGIARALSVRPDFIVLDEPTSALDVSVQAQILNMLNDLQRDFGLTYLFISHDLSIIRYMCDRVAVMYLGKIVEYAPKQELFNHPTHPYTEALLSVIPVPDPDLKRDRIILTGDVPSPANPPPGCRFHTRCPLAIPVCKIEEPPLTDRGNEHYVACHVRQEII